MYGPLKILHRSHTGRLRPHEHTSYLPLLFLLMVVGLVLALYTFKTDAATPYTGPEAGSIGLTGRVPAAPPKTAANITSPKDGQHFNTSPVTVSGTCPDNTLVEIYKNNIFAGSTPCDNGKFSIEIDPLFGQNSLTAQVYDVLNQAGPVSKAVIIFYDYSLANAAPSSILDLTGAQLLLDTDAAFRGSFPNQSMNVPITVIGGTPPFAINVLWGDSKNQVLPVASNSTFNASHAYHKPGTYKLTIQGTDSKQLTAFLSVAAIINGQPAVATAANPAVAKKALVLWPVLAIAITALISFWVGEKREKKLLKGQERPENFSLNQPPPAAKPPASSSTTS